MADAYPGYDVLAKRDGLSWNDRTRDVIDERLALREASFLSATQLRTLGAFADRLVPQPAGRNPIGTAAIIEDNLANGDGDGFQHADMPTPRAAWTCALDAIEAQAIDQHGCSFADLGELEQDAMIAAIEAGTVSGEGWGELAPGRFFKARALPDIVAAYYAHPSAWSAIGFGGPAAPRGYVRMDADRQDAWEAVEMKPDGDRRKVTRRNLNVR